MIAASSNKAVRFKFYNLLPTGPKAANGRRDGDLFLPVDETVMGSGLGPAIPGNAGETFTQNRHAVHLHGNNTVWISDGTPHQWITPANETTSYPQGVSVYNVPDMYPASVDSPKDGAMTLYYTNAMSARLMFYHDHAYGITRLNVYAGEAAGYVVTDQIDADLSTGTNVTGVNPAGLKVLPPDIGGLGVPLVIQDRTFVDPVTIGAQDPTWNWGTGPRDALPERSRDTPSATSGTPTSTCPPRILPTSAASTPSAAGTTAPGSRRRPRRAPPRTPRPGASRSGPSRTSTSALRPGSRL